MRQLAARPAAWLAAVVAWGYPCSQQPPAPTPCCLPPGKCTGSPCADRTQCRSSAGWCGKGDQWCNARSQWAETGCPPYSGSCARVSNGYMARLEHSQVPDWQCGKAHGNRLSTACGATPQGGSGWCCNAEGWCGQGERHCEPRCDPASPFCGAGWLKDSNNSWARLGEGLPLYWQAYALVSPMGNAIPSSRLYTFGGANGSPQAQRPGACSNAQGPRRRRGGNPCSVVLETRDLLSPGLSSRTAYIDLSSGQLVELSETYGLTARFGAAMASVSGLLLLFGGATSMFSCCSNLMQLDLSRPQFWVPYSVAGVQHGCDAGPSAPPRRYGHTLTAAAEWLVLFGGCTKPEIIGVVHSGDHGAQAQDIEPADVLGDTWLLNTFNSDSEWIQLSNAGNIQPRFFHAAAAHGSRVYVHGGLSVSEKQPRKILETHAELYVLDTHDSTQGWQLLSSVAQPDIFFRDNLKNGEPCRTSGMGTTCTYARAPIQPVPVTARYSHVLGVVDNMLILSGGAVIPPNSDYPCGDRKTANWYPPHNPAINRTSTTGLPERFHVTSYNSILNDTWRLDLSITETSQQWIPVVPADYRLGLPARYGHAGGGTCGQYVIAGGIENLANDNAVSGDMTHSIVINSTPKLQKSAWLLKWSTQAGNTFEAHAGTGGWGGDCTCPDGQKYQVGDRNNACGSLACIGGRSGQCNKYGGDWSGNKVTCRPPEIYRAKHDQYFEHALRFSLSGDKIVLASGEFHLDAVEISKNISITGNGEQTTLVVFGLRIACGASVGLRNLTILQGRMHSYMQVHSGTLTAFHVTFRNMHASQGGAISILGNAVFDRCAFINVSASQAGGALWLASGAQAELRNSNATTVSAKAGQGGFAFVSSSALLSLINCSISHSEASDGGAIFSEGNVSIVNSTLVNNQAHFGAAVYSMGHTRIVESRLSNNQATALGGAIAVLGGRLEMLSSRASNNHATSGGGFLAVFSDSDVSVTACNISSSSAESGGAILLMPSDQPVINSATEFVFNLKGANNNSKLQVIGSAIVGNKASRGGAMHILCCTTVVLNCTFEANRATQYDGGAILIEPQLLLPASASLEKVHFIGNSAAGMGGALMGSWGSMASDKDLLLNEIHCLDNSAHHGGCAYLSNAALTARRIEISGCCAQSTGLGSGVYLYETTGNLSLVSISRGARACTSWRGGGVAIVESHVVMTNLSVTGLVASNGAGVFVQDSLLTLLGPKIDRCNSTGSGGGLHVLRSQVIVQSGNIISCKAATGGGIFMAGGDVRGAMALRASQAVSNMPVAALMSLTNLQMLSNSALQNGGGLAVEMSAASALTMSMTDVHIGSSIAAAQGGGIYLLSPDLYPDALCPMLTSASVTRCSAQVGGGIYLESNSLSTDAIPCSTVFGNNASAYGPNLATGTAELYCPSLRVAAPPMEAFEVSVELRDAYGSIVTTQSSGNVELQSIPNAMRRSGGEMLNHTTSLLKGTTVAPVIAGLALFSELKFQQVNADQANHVLSFHSGLVPRSVASVTIETSGCGEQKMLCTCDDSQCPCELHLEGYSSCTPTPPPPKVSILWYVLPPSLLVAIVGGVLAAVWIWRWYRTRRALAIHTSLKMSLLGESTDEDGEDQGTSLDVIVSVWSPHRKFAMRVMDYLSKAGLSIAGPVDDLVPDEDWDAWCRPTSQRVTEP